MSFAQFVNFALRFMQFLSDFGGRVLDILDTPLRDLLLNIDFNEGFLWFENLLKSLGNTGLGSLTLFSFMFGAGFIIYVVITVVKWFIDIIT